MLRYQFHKIILKSNIKKQKCFHLIKQRIRYKSLLSELEGSVVGPFAAHCFASKLKDILFAILFDFCLILYKSKIIANSLKKK